MFGPLNGKKRNNYWPTESPEGERSWPEILEVEYLENGAR